MQRRKGLAHVLRRARGFSLLSQDELARALGISRRSVAGYEAGETEAPAVVVLEWLRVCGRPLDDLAEAWSDDDGDTSDLGNSPSTWIESVGPHGLTLAPA